MKKKIIIIGGVAGGATAAARLRRLSENYEIIMFEKDEYIAFANCGLPYYIGEEITDRSKLLVQTVEGMTKRYNLDIRNNTLVTKINKNEKTVTVHDLKNDRVYDESYDFVLLSPGASPIVPPFAGLATATNVYTLRNIPDTDKIKAVVDTQNPQKAVVIGGGFIGVEMAENLQLRGLDVTLIDMSDHILRPFDIEMASLLELELKQKGITLKLNAKVADVTQNYVSLSDGTEIATDLTIMAIGVKPTSELAVDAGLEVNARGAIVVDKTLRTSDEFIYAVGDAIEVEHFIDGAKTMIPLAWPANRQARVVADIIHGKKVEYPGTMGASVLKVFKLTGASVGYTTEYLKLNNIEHDSVIVHRNSHAGYYPNSSMLSLKLIFNKQSGKILGAQAVGQSGVEKRIDVIATAIKGNLTIFDLPEVELCYAPPFNSAKDPVNIAGYVASNLADGFTKMYNYDQVASILEQNKLLIDLRTKEEFEFATIAGSINIDLDTFRSDFEKLNYDKDQDIYLFCQVGLRGYVGQRILNEMGYENVYNLSGGFLTYNSFFKNQEVVKPHTPTPREDAQKKTDSDSTMKVIDAKGMQCPGPIMETYKAMNEMQAGDKLKVHVTDGGFCQDVEAWCEKCGHQLDYITSTDDGAYEAVITKSNQEHCNLPKTNSVEDKGTIVMFSGDMDKALAAMIIAQGAQAMGKQMTVFFTFWGLNVLRKSENVDVEKTDFEKMFAMMMPKGADRTKLSNMNMAGIGTKMINKRMEDKNVPDLKTQIKNAQDAGVKFIACTMSMDLMGIKEEELIDGIEFAGVAKYVGESSGADLTLFI